MNSVSAKGKAEKVELTADMIKAGLDKGKCKNMTSLAIELGALKKGQSVSGSFGKKVKSLVPDIDALFAINKESKGDGGSETAGDNVEKGEKSQKPVKEPKVKVAQPPTKPTKPPKTPKTAKAPKEPKETKETKEPKTKASSPSLYKRHEKNPFRLNSSYGKVFDCFASFKNGVRRDELLTKVSEAVGKDLKHASYDLAVILSAKESNTGPRHRSCAEGFWVKRENDNLCLMVD